MTTASPAPIPTTIGCPSIVRPRRRSARRVTASPRSRCARSDAGTGQGQLAADTYHGKMALIRDGVKTKSELSVRAQESKGTGPTAAGIFVRELAPAWKR